MNKLLNLLAQSSPVIPWAIAILFVGHLLGLLFWLYFRYDRLKTLNGHLEELSKPIEHKLSKFVDASIDDKVLAYANDLLSHSAADWEPKVLNAFKEYKPQRKLRTIEGWYLLGPTATEIYPLLGILGTVTAIAKAMSQPATSSSSSEAGPVNAEAFSHLIDAFGTALGTTILGLSFGCVMMFMHSWLDPKAMILPKIHDTIDQLFLHAGANGVAENIK